MRIGRTGLLLVAFFASLTVADPSQAAPRDRQTDTFLIRERLFRLFIRPGVVAYDEIKNPCYNQWDSRWKVCYLSIGWDKDPNPRLMAKLTNLGRTVKPRSAFHGVKHPEEWHSYKYVEEGSGTIGFGVSVGEIRWVSRNKVRVRAGYDSGGRYGGDATFTLIRRRGVWIVIKVADEMIS